MRKILLSIFLILIITIFFGRLARAQSNVDIFEIRIADMMVDLLPPNLDNINHTDRWQQAFNDLKNASPNGEITHIQLRTFWKIPNLSDDTTWNYPQLGAYDGPTGGQQTMVDNWKKWIFGYPAEPTYGPSVAERIHDAGFKMEFCLSTAWTGSGTIADSIPVFHNQPEASYPHFNGDLFLQNYMDNALRPTAQFLASSPNFHNGDIFMIAFEMSYPTSADFTWNHNQRWIQMIDEVRQIFINAGKPNVLLTIDINAWWDDFGLGYDALNKLISQEKATNNPIPLSVKGISGATFLSHLDFISLSFWLGLLRASDIPTTWTDSHIETLALPAWSNSPRWCKAGTGHGMVSCSYGRDFLADFGALSQVMDNKKILLNTGWTNGHNTLYSSGRFSGGPIDNEAQKVAWVAQVKALGNNSWSVGQDFERYCADKTIGTTRIDTSWRNSLAQPAIIQAIQEIINQKSPITTNENIEKTEPQKEIETVSSSQEVFDNESGITEEEKTDINQSGEVSVEGPEKKSFIKSILSFLVSIFNVLKNFFSRLFHL